MNVNELINNIESLNIKLEKDYDQFENDMKSTDSLIIYNKVYESNINELNNIRSSIISIFIENRNEKKVRLWDIVKNNKEFLNYLSYKVEFVDELSLKKLLILEIFRNLRVDPRDNYIYLGRILKKAKTDYSLDVKHALIDILPLADTEDWSGMGSMKKFLENVVENNY